MIKQKIKKHFRKGLIGLIATFAIVGSFLYYTIQVESLTKLGYSDNQAKEKVKISTIYNIVSNQKNTLNSSIQKYTKILHNLGVSQEKITSLTKNETKLLAKEIALRDYATSRQDDLESELKILKKQADNLKIKYDLKDKKVNTQVNYLNKLVSRKINKLTSNYKSFLLDNGYSKADIKKMMNKSDYQNMLNLKKKVTSEKKKQKANSGFQTKELKNQAMRMFRLTNEYRRSLGLKPYTYNYAKQSCVFKEAKAYSQNKNPHNWACPCANENAGLSSINSDYVAVAMKFFKNDPPHEAVLSGNYSSVAIAFVEKDGMVYMIMDVF